MINRIALFAVFAALHPFASQGSAAGGDYVRDIKPLLKEKCVKCHGPERQENGLRLDSAAAVLRGGDRGPAVVPGDAEGSLLIRAVKGEEEDMDAMPPDDAAFRDEQIALLVKWIDDGAAAPENERE